VISWRPQVGASPAISALTETVGDTTYALLMILPPAAAHLQNAQPARADLRHRQLRLDGRPVDAASQSRVEGRARPMRGGDLFNIVDFDSTTNTLYPAPRAFSTTTHGQALAFVDGLVADGGTEIGRAIAVALAQPATPGYLRQAIFMTDGAVGAETSVFDEIQRSLRDYAALHDRHRLGAELILHAQRPRSSGAAPTRTSAMSATSTRR
jgi:Ca-activated chloride channel family protein